MSLSHLLIRLPSLLYIYFLFFIFLAAKVTNDVSHKRREGRKGGGRTIGANSSIFCRNSLRFLSFLVVLSASKLAISASAPPPLSTGGSSSGLLSSAFVCILTFVASSVATKGLGGGLSMSTSASTSCIVSGSCFERSGAAVVVVVVVAATVVGVVAVAVVEEGRFGSDG